MQHIEGPLRLLTIVRQEMERGNSVFKGIQVYLSQTGNFSDYDKKFTETVIQWISARQRGQEFKLDEIGVYRRTLLEILSRGLSGESIFNHLNTLEKEFIEAYEDSMERFLAKLPFLLMIPLLLLQFPAFLFLLFGPVLKNMLGSL